MISEIKNIKQLMANFVMSMVSADGFVSLGKNHSPNLCYKFQGYFKYAHGIFYLRSLKI